jgi:hypothetical protein
MAKRKKSQDCYYEYYYDKKGRRKRRRVCRPRGGGGGGGGVALPPFPNVPNAPLPGAGAFGAAYQRLPRFPQVPNEDIEDLEDLGLIDPDERQIVPYNQNRGTIVPFVRQTVLNRNSPGELVVAGVQNALYNPAITNTFQQFAGQGLTAFLSQTLGLYSSIFHGGAALDYSGYLLKHGNPLAMALEGGLAYGKVLLGSATPHKATLDFLRPHLKIFADTLGYTVGQPLAYALDTGLFQLATTYLADRRAGRDDYARQSAELARQVIEFLGVGAENSQRLLTGLGTSLGIAGSETKKALTGAAFFGVRYGGALALVGPAATRQLLLKDLAEKVGQPELTGAIQSNFRSNRERAAARAPGTTNVTSITEVEDEVPLLIRPEGRPQTIIPNIPAYSAIENTPANPDKPVGRLKGAFNAFKHIVSDVADRAAGIKPLRVTTQRKDVVIGHGGTKVRAIIAADEKGINYVVPRGATEQAFLGQDPRLISEGTRDALLEAPVQGVIGEAVRDALL